jgi:hypothetical protein
VLELRDAVDHEIVGEGLKTSYRDGAWAVAGLGAFVRRRQSNGHACTAQKPEQSRLCGSTIKAGRMRAPSRRSTLSIAAGDPAGISRSSSLKRRTVSVSGRGSSPAIFTIRIRTVWVQRRGVNPYLGGSLCPGRRLDQSLIDRHRHRRRAQDITEIVGQCTKLQAYHISGKGTARQPCPFDRTLSFLIHCSRIPRFL